MPAPNTTRQRPPSDVWVRRWLGSNAYEIKLYWRAQSLGVSRDVAPNPKRWDRIARQRRWLGLHIPAIREAWAFAFTPPLPLLFAILLGCFLLRQTENILPPLPGPDALSPETRKVIVACIAFGIVAGGLLWDRLKSYEAAKLIPTLGLGGAGFFLPIPDHSVLQIQFGIAALLAFMFWRGITTDRETGWLWLLPIAFIYACNIARTPHQTEILLLVRVLLVIALTALAGFAIYELYVKDRVQRAGAHLAAGVFLGLAFTFPSAGVQNVAWIGFGGAVLVFLLSLAVEPLPRAFWDATVPPWFTIALHLYAAFVMGALLYLGGGYTPTMAVLGTPLVILILLACFAALMSWRAVQTGAHGGQLARGLFNLLTGTLGLLCVIEYIREQHRIFTDWRPIESSGGLDLGEVYGLLFLASSIVLGILFLSSLKGSGPLDEFRQQWRPDAAQPTGREALKKRGVIGEG